MQRSLGSRLGLAVSLVCVLAFGAVMTSCGGGGKGAREMKLVQLLYVDRSLEPTAATGVENLPRNAQLLFVFSEQVNANTVDEQTIQLRYGGAFQSVPKGSFSVTGNQVRFDPTVTSQGQPNPFGFLPITQHSIDIPNFEEQDGVIENLDFDPNLSSFFTTFTTGDGFLRELVPPEVVDVFFVPERDPLTGNVPGNGIMAIEFSEAMDPGTFIQGPKSVPPGESLPDITTIDIRNTLLNSINIANMREGQAIPGNFTHDPAAKVYFFQPLFSFGDKKYEFQVQLFQGLKDLSGNLLVNPRSFGPFTADGRGSPIGEILQEDFVFDDDMDMTASTPQVDWGQTQEGTLFGAPLTTREARIYTYRYVQNRDQDGNVINSGRGMGFAAYEPLIGAAINARLPNLSPASSLGRRMLWAFGDGEMGASGTVTAAAWGPDGNVTFAATYDEVVLRCGFQRDNSLQLTLNFEGNYEGSPTILYKGQYNVLQSTDVGDTPGEPQEVHVPAIGPPWYPACVDALGNEIPWNAPAFNSTGWYEWPALTNFFDWDNGDPAVENDRVFLFGASVTEGDTHQLIRSWRAIDVPCGNTFIAGFPGRGVVGTHEAENGISNPGGTLPQSPVNNNTGIQALAIAINPTPVVSDTRFTITRRRSLAQSLFYTPDTFAMGGALGGFTLGTSSDYLAPQVEPVVQPGGAQIIVEYQGAMGLDPMGRDTINVALPFTEWTQDVNDCDGFPNIRWRVTLIANIQSNTVATAIKIAVPILPLP